MGNKTKDSHLEGSRKRTWVLVPILRSAPCVKPGTPPTAVDLMFPPEMLGFPEVL